MDSELLRIFHDIRMFDLTPEAFETISRMIFIAYEKGFNNGLDKGMELSKELLHED